MEATMTPEDLALLKAFFAPDEHEFLDKKSGGGGTFTYVKEYAITERLDAVDPCWQLHMVNAYRQGNQCICIVELMIKGVTRVGVGQSDILLKKDGGGEANEAEKSAVTDALKRAARLHGVGRYLLNTPKSVTNEQTLAKWLQSLNGAKSHDTSPISNGTPQTGVNSTHAQNARAQNGHDYIPKSAAEWRGVYAHIATFPYFAFDIMDNPVNPAGAAEHAKNAVKKMFEAGTLKKDMTAHQIFDYMESYQGEGVAF